MGGPGLESLPPVVQDDFDFLTNGFDDFERWDAEWLELVWMLATSISEKPGNTVVGTSVRKRRHAQWEVGARWQAISEP